MKLLRHVKIILTVITAVTLLTSGVCRANDDIKWANDLRDSSIEMVWQSFKEQFEAQERLEASSGLSLDGREQPSRRFGGLYVFASTSMPKSLLKNVNAEANKYGGVLVLKGLPNGSFRELAKLVTEVTSKEEDMQSASLQIDDEAFERFSITSVPTIVMAKMSDYHPNQTGQLKFDRIVGNVGIRFALEKFAEDGELKEEAIAHFNVLKIQ